MRGREGSCREVKEKIRGNLVDAAVGDDLEKRTRGNFFSTV